MVIVTLVAAGVGLAKEKFSDRKTRKEEEARRRNFDNQFGGAITRIDSEEQRRREEEAFNELQVYANFQSELSSKCLNDVANEDTSTASSSIEKGLTNYGPSQPQEYSPPHAKLQWPIIIPQDTRIGDGSFVRAFPPPLLEFGIDHHTFFGVIDSLIVHMRLSARLEAVNIARMAPNPISNGWQDGSENLSRVIPSAVQAMKAHQRNRKSKTFLNQANGLTFGPCGLFAMIVTSRPDLSSDVITIDIATSSMSQEFRDDTEMSMEDVTAQSEASSGHISPIASSSSSKLEEEDTMDIASVLNPSPTIKDGRPKRLGPESTARSNLSSFFSSRRKIEITNKRVQKGKRPVSRANPNSAKVFENSSASSFAATPSQSKRVDALRPIANSMNIQRDALYLVIVNDPDASPFQTTNTKAPHMEVYRHQIAATTAPFKGSRGIEMVPGGMIAESMSIASNASNKPFYDSVHNAPQGAPPAYSPA